MFLYFFKFDPMVYFVFFIPVIIFLACVLTLPVLCMDTWKGKLSFNVRIKKAMKLFFVLFSSLVIIGAISLTLTFALAWLFYHPLGFERGGEYILPCVVLFVILFFLMFVLGSKNSHQRKIVKYMLYGVICILILPFIISFLCYLLERNRYCFEMCRCKDYSAEHYLQEKAFNRAFIAE
ncbi:MAG: hypothetical protein LBU87_03930 [Lactobacillales bacterium]|jgi:hypothetical protein|nr:hypothetical protein [Lactobacillales bacterium]